MNLSATKESSEVYILDHQAAVRETLTAILEAGGYKAICFANERSLLKSVRRHCPTAVILDADLPKRSALEVLKELTEYSAPVLMMSDYGTIPTAVNAIKGGAADFFQKPSGIDDILDRLNRTVASFNSHGNRTTKKCASARSIPGHTALSRRELDVLQHVASGSTNKEIGKSLDISHRTVEQYRAQIMRKLGVKNVTELMLAVLG